MRISKKTYQEKVSLTFYVDAEKLHKTKVKSGAIDKGTSVEDSLFYDMTQLQMDIYSHVKDYFDDYGKEIFLELDDTWSR